MNPLFKFALKNLKKTKIRSLLSILAVFLGVLLITTLLVMTDSLVAAVDDSLDLLSGTVVLQQEDAVDPNFSIIDSSVIAELVAANSTGGEIEGTIAAYVPEIWHVEKSEAGIFGFLQVIGVQPSAERNTVGVLAAENFPQGRTLSDDDYNATVIGDSAAQLMNKGIGDTVVVNGQNIEVVGIFSTDSFLDNAMFMHINIVETFSPQYEDQEFISTILIKPVDLAAGGKIKTYVNDVLAAFRDENNDGITEEYDIEASDFEQIAEQGRQFLDITTEYAFYLGLISIVIGSLSVFNSILMGVLERKREIAILKATGWTDYETGLEVFIESLIISIIGGVGGLSLGVGIAGYFTSTSQFLSLVVNPITLVQSFVYAVLLGIFAGLYPAWRAMRIDPVEDLVG